MCLGIPVRRYNHLCHKQKNGDHSHSHRAENDSGFSVLLSLCSFGFFFCLALCLLSARFDLSRFLFAFAGTLISVLISADALQCDTCIRELKIVFGDLSLPACFLIIRFTLFLRGAAHFLSPAVSGFQLGSELRFGLLQRFFVGGFGGPDTLVQRVKEFIFQCLQLLLRLALGVAEGAA